MWALTILSWCAVMTPAHAQRTRDSAAVMAGSPAVIVASKPFGESYLLAEMFAQLLESRGILVTRRPGQIGRAHV